MAINDYKISVEETVGKVIGTLDTRPTLSAAELKNRFDSVPTKIIEDYNAFIDFLQSNEFAECVGVISAHGNNLQEIINFLQDKKIGSEDVKFIRLNSDNVIETSIDGEIWVETNSIALAEKIRLIESRVRENEIEIDVAQSDILSNKSDIEILENKIGANGGIATLGSDGKIVQNIDASKITTGELPLSVIPSTAKIRNIAVANFDDALSLTIADVQNGDFVVIEDEIGWYQVVDDTKLGTIQAFRKVPTGVVGQAIMAQQFDPNYVGGNSIGKEFTNLQTSKANISQLPIKVSQLTNDSGFDTAVSVDTKIANSGGAIIQATEPTGRSGAVWVNSTTGIIKYWNGTAWASIFGVFA